MDSQKHVSLIPAASIRPSREEEDCRYLVAASAFPLSKSCCPRAATVSFLSGLWRIDSWQTFEASKAD